MSEIINHFRNDVKKLAEKYHTLSIVFWVQAFWYFLRYGASPNDYIRYELYLKNGRGVNEYITALRQKKIVKMMNHNDDGELKDDKYETNCRFGAYISRDWIKIDRNSDIEEIIRFIKTHDTIVVKPLSLSGGKGIEKYVCKEIADIRAFIGELQTGEHLIEEAVKQHEDMNVFNPYSVNTLRIYTLCDRNGGVVIIDAFVRMATQKIAVDNCCSGGCAAAVDIDTGIVISPAGNYERNYYIVSPITKKTIIGREIPSWEKAKMMCTAMAKELFKEGKRYIAFDIAILQSGQPELIEVNWFGDPILRQINGCRPHGKYREIKNFF